MTAKCRTAPCETCPYRKDVPSGVWDKSEYTKLIEYDRPTGEQPLAPFCCHTSPDFLCTGWAQVHGGKTKRGYESLAMRFIQVLTGPVEIPEVSVPLFENGNAAAVHGLRDIDHPSFKARLAVTKLMRVCKQKAKR